MAYNWIRTTYPGVRFREHSSRKYNNFPDKYFTLRYKRNGKTIEEGVGWSSENFNALQSSILRSQIVHNIKMGHGPQSLKEIRNQNKETNKKKRQKKEQERRDALTFANVADEFIFWAKNNKKSWEDDYLRVEKILKPQLGKHRLIDLDRQHGLDLTEFLKEQKSKNGKYLSAATVRQYLTLARRIINFAMDMTLKGTRMPMFDGQNPFRRIKMPKIDNIRWRCLSYDEAEILLKTVQKPYVQALIRTNDQAFKLYIICRFSLYTGARLSEILHLTPECIFSDSCTVRLADTKHGSRSVYPDEQTMEHLNSLITKENLYIFQSMVRGKKDQPWSKDFVSHAFSKIINDKTDINTKVTDPRNRITFHSLRHTYGTWQIYGGMDIETLSRLMGHTDLMTTRRYLHLAEDFKAQMAARTRAKNMQVRLP